METAISAAVGDDSAQDPGARANPASLAQTPNKASSSAVSEPIADVWTAASLWPCFARSFYPENAALWQPRTSPTLLDAKWPICGQASSARVSAGEDELVRPVRRRRGAACGRGGGRGGIWRRGSAGDGRGGPGGRGGGGAGPGAGPAHTQHAWLQVTLSAASVMGLSIRPGLPLWHVVRAGFHPSPQQLQDLHAMVVCVDQRQEAGCACATQESPSAGSRARTT